MSRFKDDIEHLWFEPDGHYAIRLERAGHRERKHGTEALLYVLEGEAEWLCGSSSSRLEHGDFLCVNSPGEWEIRNAGAKPTTVLAIEFSCARIGRSGGGWDTRSYAIPFSGVLCPKSRALSGHRMELLYKALEERSDGRAARGEQTMFRQLWESLAEEDGHSGKRTTQDSDIEQIALLLKENTGEDFPVEQLARKMGLSVSEFYKRFKNRKGISPAQYAIDQRIRKSRLLLSGSSMKVSEVAHSVGYGDEYYFSRMFKKKVGLSPARFIHCSRRKIAALSWEIEDTMLALGIRPCCSVVDAPRPWDWSKVIRRVAEQLRAAAPDVILAPPGLEPYLDILSRTAPVHLIPSKGEHWHSHLIRIAELLEMKEAAFAWLDAYQARESQVRHRLAQSAEGDTVLVVRAGRESFDIYGPKMRRVGEFVYKSLGLTAPASLRDVRHLEVNRWRDLEQFGADRIVCLLDERSGGRAADFEALTAACESKVYTRSAYPWTHYSALGHDLMLNDALDLFSR